MFLGCDLCAVAKPPALAGSALLLLRGRDAPATFSCFELSGERLARCWGGREGDVCDPALKSEWDRAYGRSSSRGAGIATREAWRDSRGD